MYQANFYNQLSTSVSLDKQIKKVEEFRTKRSEILISESVYYINKSRSKWVSVGFLLERKYTPVIKLGGYKYNQHILFNEDQWISFLNNQGVMLSFIYSNSYGWQPMQGDGYEIHFIFMGDSRVIKITQDGGNELYLAGDTINELVNLVNLVKYRFDMLKFQEFSKYYNTIVSGVSLQNGDLIKNIYDVITPNPNSANVCCVLELLQFYPESVIEDVETFACNEFVKSIIKK